MFNSYIDNLRYVLNSVGILLDNIDANKVVISADHGEGFGEYNTYDHPFGSLNPYVRRVPWIVASAEDNETYKSQFDAIGPSEVGEKEEKYVNETLKNLGYM